MTLIFSICGIIIIFYVLARICDTHFMESLSAISNRLGLSSDISGATFMAMGSSAPELFTAIIAIVRVGTKNIGVGTIVGSALFNLLVIIGVAAIVAPIFVRWKSVVRDLVFYLVSVGLLLWSFQDGIVSFWETSGYVLLYVAYIIVLANWKKIDPILDEVYQPDESLTEKVKHRFHIFTEKLLSKTFPNLVHKPHLYPVTFLLSIIYIGILSAFLVELAIQVADQLSIPPAVVALTVLAAGTSVPDLLASASAARRGFGTMAVSNAIGSNTFNILIGLGLPWLIYSLVSKQGIVVTAESINSSTWILFGSVALFLVWMFVQKFVLKKASGVFFLTIYGAYLTYIVLMTLGVL